MQENQFDAAPPSITLGEVYYVLFKHKWRILLLAAAGVLAAVLVWLAWPVQYISEASILIKYVQGHEPPAAVTEGSRIQSADPHGDSVINSEIEILRSFNLAQDVAAAVGPEKILAKLGQGADAGRAAAMVSRDLTVVSGPSTVLHLAFQHPDPGVVQPVLRAVLDEYRRKHVEIHQASGWHDELLARETDKLRSQLTQTEEDLRKAYDRIGVLSLEEAKKSYAEQMSRIRDELLAAEVALAELQATVNQLTGSPDSTSAPGTEPALPPDQVAEYKRVSSQLERLREQEQALTLLYREAHPVVKAVHGQIAEMENRKTSLEQSQPALATLRLPLRTVPDRASATQFDLVTESARVRGIESRIRLLNEQWENVRQQAAKFSEAEPVIAELERQKAFQEARYRILSTSREQVRIADALGAGKISNIAEVQAPSPPRRDTGVLGKVLAGLILGGLLSGLGLAFVWELWLNQTVRRPVEIEAKLGMPLLLSLPWVHGNGKGHIGRKVKALLGQPDGPVYPGETTSTDIAPWALNHGLRTFMEALRDRLLFYFDVRNLTHKPKLVAVTGCGEGAGVSTIAAGLAATLSETGDGNVLLVDMSMGHHMPYHFHKGDLQFGLNELLQGENRERALVQDHLYVVSHATGDDKLERILPKRFHHLVPKLKASDYDYIIFDMPPVSQISVTPQLARYMDMVLMVVESEKTNRDVLTRANNLLAECKANVSVVLNKTRNHVPQRLQQEI